jgi:hypothetical protein
VRSLAGAGASVRLVVEARGERAATRILRAHGLRYRVRRAGARTAFAIGARRATGDDIPWAREVEAALRTAAVPVVMYRVD